MKLKSPPKDVLVTLAVVVGLGLLFVGAVWWPNSRSKADHQRRADEATQRLANITASEAQRLQLEQAVRDLEDGIETDEHYIPNAPQLSDMLRGLTESARASGVWEQELATDEFKRYAEFSVIPASLNFESGFASAIGVLESIEKQRRLTAVKRTALDRVRTNDDEPPGQSRVSLELELVSFYAAERGSER
ncbi:MAG: hypothetical protein AAF916_08965 [Planctomycetota bacterium]